MIGKVTRGRDTGGLLRYLFGPGRANEHLEPRLVASWLGDDPATLAELEPAIVAGRRDVAPLTARLTLPLQLQPEIDRPVWQCSMRTADGDHSLSDEEWAEVARDVVHRTGFAPHGDEAACRWVAVRHADDHIHIAVALARMDGHPVWVFRDWPKVHAAARAAEQRFGLQIVASPNRTASVVPTSAEAEKAHRTASAEPARRWLTRQVRAAARSTSRTEFADRLDRRGVLIMWRESQRTPGQITGYAVGRPGDIDAAGGQIWFGGSKLAPDLSLPKIAIRWAEASTNVATSNIAQTGAPVSNPRSAGRSSTNRAGRAESRTRELSGISHQRNVPRPSTPTAPPGWSVVGAGLSLLAGPTQGERRYAMLVATNLARISDALQAASAPRNPRNRAAPIVPRARRVSSKRTPKVLAPRSMVSRSLPSDNRHRDTSSPSPSRS